MSAAVNIGDISEDALNLRDMMNGVLERVESVFQSYNVPLPQRTALLLAHDSSLKPV